MRFKAALGLGLGLLAGLLLAAPATAAPRSWPGLPSKHAPREDEDEEPEVERLTQEELRQRLPALRTRAEPRVVQGSLGFGIRFFYLPLGIEGTLDLYPAPWLRVGLVYAAGLSFKWDGQKTPQCWEAAVLKPARALVTRLILRSPASNSTSASRSAELLTTGCSGAEKTLVRPVSISGSRSFTEHEARCSARPAPFRLDGRVARWLHRGAEP